MLFLMFFPAVIAIFKTGVKEWTLFISVIKYLFVIRHSTGWSNGSSLATCGISRFQGVLNAFFLWFFQVPTTPLWIAMTAERKIQNFRILNILTVAIAVLKRGGGGSCTGDEAIVIRTKWINAISPSGNRFIFKSKFQNIFSLNGLRGFSEIF